MADLEEWRRAERAALDAEQAAREAARAGTDQRRHLATGAKQLRAYSDRLWRQFLGSSLSPLAAVTPEPVTPEPERTNPIDTASLHRRIEEWRRAQARAHAAEVKAVHAYCRYVQAIEDEAPYACLSEAMLLREESTARLQRVFEEANRLRNPRRT